MAKEIPASVHELNRIAESAGALGIERKNIVGFTRVIADMGETTNLVGEEASAAMARLANITKMPQKEFGRLGSTIVDLGNKGASTEAEIAAMGLRLAAAGTQAGLSLPEILGFANAMSSVGIEAEAGGSAMSRTFAKIGVAVMEGGKSLEGFAQVAGMSGAQFQKSFKDDAAGTVLTFVEGLGRIKESGGNVYAALKKLDITDLRSIDTLLRLSGAGDLARESVQNGNKAWSEGTALQVEAGKRYETLASQLEILKNKAIDFGISVGQQITPSIMAAIPHIEALGAKVASWGPQVTSGVNVAKGALTGLGTVIQSSVGQFGIAAVASAAVFAGAMGKMMASYKALALAMAAHPFLAALTVAVGLLGGSIYTLITNVNGAERAMRAATAAIKQLQATAEAAKGSQLGLAEAKNRLTQATLAVTSAIKTKTTAEKTSGTASLAYKQAQNQVEAAYIARKRAALDVTAAEKANAAAQAKATEVQRVAKASVANLSAEYGKLSTATGDTARGFLPLGEAAKAIDKSRGGEHARNFAKDMQTLADKAGTTAKSLEKTSPALAMMAKNIAAAAGRNAELARELGKIPDVIAKVKGPSSKSASDVGSGIKSGVVAGASGVGAALVAQLQPEIFSAVAQLKASIRAKSPSGLTRDEIGKPLGLGVVDGWMLGVSGLGTSMSRSLHGATASAKGTVDQLAAKLANQEAMWARFAAALTPVEAQLAKMGEAEEKRSQQAAVRGAREELAKARSITNAKERAAAITAAAESLRVAELAITTSRLEQVAERERAGRDKQVTVAVAAIERMRVQIAAKTEQLGSSFAKLGDYIGRAFGAKTQQMLDAVSAKFDAQIGKVRTLAGELTSAERALQAFDAAGSGGPTASEQELVNLDAGEAERSRQLAVMAAEEAMAKAQAITDAVERAAAVLAAEEQMRTAQLAITRQTLTERAAVERAGRDAELAEQRAALALKAGEERAARDQQAAEQIAALEASKAAELQNLTEQRRQQEEQMNQTMAAYLKQLEKNPKAHAKIHGQIVTMLRGYGVDMRNSGELLGDAFARGLDDAAAAVRKAARGLAQVAANNLKLSSPAREGPLSSLDSWWSKLGKTLVGGVTVRPVEQMASRMAAAAYPGMVAGPTPMFAGAGAARGGGYAGNGGGGGNTYILHADRYVGSREELFADFRTMMRREADRNR